MIIVAIFRCSLLLFLDVTPLKSPNPETEAPDLKALSSSSSVEVVPLDGSEDSQADHLQQYVQERMASLGLKPGKFVNPLGSFEPHNEETLRVFRCRPVCASLQSDNHKAK